MALTDEFWSGVAVVAAPEVEREQRIDHGGYALLVFALPLLGSAFLEAALSLVSDRYPRRRVTAIALVAMAAALVLCAFAQQGAALAVGLALAGAASGVACAAAQAELVVANPRAGARAMTRWVLFGSVGDVLTPLLVAVVLSAGGSYRAAFLLAAALASFQSAALAGGAAPRADRADAPEGTDASAAADARERSALDAALPAASAAPAERRSGDADPEDAEAVPLRAALSEGIRNARLWRWLVGAGLCTLLDEIVVALAALHAERDLGAGASGAVACVTGVSAGAVLGSWLTARSLARSTPDRLLFASTFATLLSLAAVVAAPSVPWLALALVALGASAAPQYALLKAKAYAASPGRPGVVNALAQVFVLIDITGPLALGALADNRGVGAALAALALQPVGVLLLLVTGWTATRRRSSERGVRPEL